MTDKWTMTGGTQGEKKVAIVLMPFIDAYDDIYLIGIKEVVEKRGYSCTRVDDNYFPGQIVEEIQRSIAESDVIIAEMTDKNPNVYYEVGYAHGINKYPILITKEAKELPFDLRGYKHIVYRGEIKTLRIELERYLDWIGSAYSSTSDIIRDPTKLRKESKQFLFHLYRAGEDRPAAECIERARGVFGIINDLRFLEYIRFYGPLLPHTPVHLTERGKEAAERLLQEFEAKGEIS